MIDKEEFTALVLQGYTVKELQTHFGVSRSHIYVLKNRYDLVGKSPNIYVKPDTPDGYKKCSKCNETLSLEYFYGNGYQPNGKKKYKPSCKTCENKSRYDSFYLKIETALNNLGKTYSCEVCGYNKNNAALCFHHLDPSKKDFEFASLSKTSNLTQEVLDEIDKCVVLCHNCHMETHYPHLTNVPLIND